jgi:predicted nucleic acid-binding Zn finger protein
MNMEIRVGTPQRCGAGWFVPSGAVGYYVEVTKKTGRCTCPSFVWRRTRLPHGECKHIAAVRRMLQQKNGVES